jgi:hypothetical protein
MLPFDEGLERTNLKDGREMYAAHNDHSQLWLSHTKLNSLETHPFHLDEPETVPPKMALNPLGVPSYFHQKKISRPRPRARYERFFRRKKNQNHWKLETKILEKKRLGATWTGDRSGGAARGYLYW